MVLWELQGHLARFFQPLRLGFFEKCSFGLTLSPYKPLSAWAVGKGGFQKKGLEALIPEVGVLGRGV